LIEAPDQRLSEAFGFASGKAPSRRRRSSARLTAKHNGLPNTMDCQTQWTAKHNGDGEDADSRA